MASIPADLNAVGSLTADRDATYADSGSDPTVKLHQQDHDALLLALQAVRAAFPGLVAATDPVAITAPTASYTLTISDIGRVVRLTTSGASTLTVPTNASVAFPIGTIIEVEQAGAGQVTISSSASLQSAAGTKTRTQFSVVSLLKVATDTWRLAGDTTT